MLLNEGEDTLSLASAAGFRCFTEVEGCKDYLRREVLGEELAI